jgi:hypothetical protein
MKGKLANPCAKDDIINRLSTGESSNQIANDYNVSGQRIRQIKKENLELIESKAQELLDNLPNIVETAKEDILLSKDITKILKSEINSYDEDVQRSVGNKLKFKTITNKLSADILRSVGIFPAQSPSIVFNQFNIDNSKHLNVDPVIMKLFSGDFSKSMQVVDMNEENLNNVGETI